MCDSCGCISNKAETKTLELNQSLLEANNKLAEKNRLLIEEMGAVCINLISSPGAGKTTLLEKTIQQLGKQIKIGVIEGDIETEKDADRIRAQGVPAVQLTTGGACHLDAPLVHKGLHQLKKENNGRKLDIIFIENVGNLVCPAAFYLGEHNKTVILSVPEGSDKPAKYPRAFVDSHLFIISKTDLIEHFDFSIDEAKTEALKLNSAIEILEISATTGDGMDMWYSSLKRSLGA